MDTLWILPPMTYTESAFKGDILIASMNMGMITARKATFRFHLGTLLTNYEPIFKYSVENGWENISKIKGTKRKKSEYTHTCTQSKNVINEKKSSCPHTHDVFCLQQKYCLTSNRPYEPFYLTESNKFTVCNRVRICAWPWFPITGSHTEIWNKHILCLHGS